MQRIDLEEFERYPDFYLDMIDKDDQSEFAVSNHGKDAVIMLTMSTC